MDKTIFSNWRAVKAYLENLTKANIEYGKLMFEFESYAEMCYVRRRLNTEADQWGYPLDFKIVEQKLYFYRTDLA